MLNDAGTRTKLTAFIFTVKLLSCGSPTVISPISPPQLEYTYNLGTTTLEIQMPLTVHSTLFEADTVDCVPPPFLDPVFEKSDPA